MPPSGRSYTAGPRHKIAKTTPCKVEWAPGRVTRAACIRGASLDKILPGRTPGKPTLCGGVAQRPEEVPHLPDKQLRLLESREMAALRHFTPVPDIRVTDLHPAPHR